MLRITWPNVPWCSVSYNVSYIINPTSNNVCLIQVTLFYNFYNFTRRQQVRLILDRVYYADFQNDELRGKKNGVNFGGFFPQLMKFTPFSYPTLRHLLKSAICLMVRKVTITFFLQNCIDQSVALERVSLRARELLGYKYHNLSVFCL